MQARNLSGERIERSQLSLNKWHKASSWSPKIVYILYNQKKLYENEWDPGTSTSLWYLIQIYTKNEKMGLQIDIIGFASIYLIVFILLRPQLSEGRESAEPGVVG